MSWIKKIAQRFYDPDDPLRYEDEPDFETGVEPEVEPGGEDLPVVTPENIYEYFDEDDNSEGTFLDEIPQDFTQKPEVPETQPVVDPWEGVDDRTLTPAQLIEKSISLQQCLFFQYVTIGGVDTGSRIVEPYGTFLARTTGRNIMCSFDRHRQDIRAFWIDNMKNIKLLYGDFYHHNMDKFVFKPY